jgi:ubiquitin carboxyl-terminal hydrolase 9/24
LQSKDTAIPPKCKNYETRNQCLSLVQELTVDNQEGTYIVIDYLRSNLLSNNVSWFWRTPRRTDWSVTAENKIGRSGTGYVGLKNIGCICYMNSIMQ